MSMSLSFAFECSVCFQLITAKKRGDTASMAALCGSAAYAVCPSCRQEVEEHTDPEYREAARRYVAEQTVAELIELNPQLFKKGTSK